MSQTQAIANCPNSKCNKPIFIDHDYSWCTECGEPLPNNIRAKLPKLQKIRADATGIRADSNLSTEADLTSAGGVLTGVSNQVLSLMKRYKDAYLVARLTDGFGGLIKGIGIAVAILLVLVGFLLFGAGRAGDATFALGIVIILFGIFVGIQFYLLGVLVSAQGQILKASLDSAVNNSPFLTNEHRAKIMSLPEA